MVAQMQWFWIALSKPAKPLHSRPTSVSASDTSTPSERSSSRRTDPVDASFELHFDDLGDLGEAEFFVDVVARGVRSVGVKKYGRAGGQQLRRDMVGDC